MDLIKRPKQVQRADKGYMTNEQYQDYAEKQFKNIYDYLDMILHLSGNMKHNSKTISSTSSSGEYKNVCSLTLPKGEYLILGACDSNTSNSSETVQVRFNLSNATLKGGLITYRGTMAQGGGTSGWCVVNIENEGTITLQTYMKSSYQITGKMTSIPLIY